MEPCVNEPEKGCTIKGCEKCENEDLQLRSQSSICARTYPSPDHFIW
jgi:hypothetical protein